MTTLRNWIRTSPHPLARITFRSVKAVRRASVPVIPGLHKGLYHMHRGVTAGLHTLARVAWYTPLFRSRLLSEASGSGLQISGLGMPFVSGPLDIGIGANCRLSSAMTLSGRGAANPTGQRPTLTLGDNVGIGWQTTIAVGNRVVLEDNVRIAGRAFLAGYPGHPIDAEARALGKPDTADQIGDIVLRRDVWLGTGCTISAGVEIGAGTIVAAGSVVTKSLPPGVLAAGVPARVIRRLSSDVEPFLPNLESAA